MPHVQILDEHGGVLVEKYYKKGSTIELKCIVRDLPQTLADVTWKHSHHLLNHETARGGIRFVSVSLSAHIGASIPSASRHGHCPRSMATFGVSWTQKRQRRYLEASPLEREAF